MVVEGRGGKEHYHSPLRHFIQNGSSQLCFLDEEPKAERGYMTCCRSPGSKIPNHVTGRSIISFLWAASFGSISQPVKLSRHKSSGSVGYFKPGWSPGAHCFPFPRPLPFLSLQDKYPRGYCLFFPHGQPLPGLAIPNDFKRHMSPLPRS